VKKLSAAGIAVSLFVDPDLDQLAAAARIRSPCIELHTGRFCDARGRDAEREMQRLIRAARFAHDAGLQVNAGHGINLENIAGILRIPHLDTLNIGHSIVCRAVLVGLRRAVTDMLRAMKRYRGGEAG
jgi:pyridoxine 5-phosphate synthase